MLLISGTTEKSLLSSFGKAHSSKARSVVSTAATEFQIGF
jgi:hypothetical protein